MGRTLKTGIAGLLLTGGLTMTMGCQTWMGGMTLPSPNYLNDSPDYLPPPPTFPLANELSAMQADNEDADDAGAGGAIAPR